MKTPYVIKKCKNCGKLLVACEFNFRKTNGKYGVHSLCRRCEKEYNIKYRKDNKEKIRVKKAEYYINNKDNISEQHKDYYRKNKERLLIHNKEYRNTIQGQLAIFNSNCKHRQLKDEQGRGITVEQYEEMMNFFDGKCAYSGLILKQETKSLDHIIALSEGGLNEPWNLLPTFFSLNQSKWKTEMEEWYRQQPFFSQERLDRIYEWKKYAYEKWS